jgi:hypothetical protein
MAILQSYNLLERIFLSIKLAIAQTVILSKNTFKQVEKKLSSEANYV